MPFSELASFLQAQTEPHILFNTEYRIIAVNQAFQKYCHPGESVIGRTCYAVSHNYSMPCNHSGETCPLAKSRHSGKTERVLHMHHTPYGEEYVSIELTPIKDRDGNICCFVEKIEPVKIAGSTAEKDRLQGQSAPYRKMMALVEKAARSDIHVLLSGEPGTGKGLVALTIHRLGKRAAKPFITVDCSGIAETDFESELFGHDRKTHGRATSGKKGLIDAAEGGTLFLDGIADIPLAIQAKLIRLLETGAYRRLGSAELHRADTRIISATSSRIQEKTEENTFRKDLYYRLNLFPIRVPALRDRLEDIPLLAQSLLKRIAPERAVALSSDALYALQHYSYPGNIRELGNFLERACLLCETNTIQLEHLLLPEQAETQKNAALSIHERLKQQLPLFKGNRKTLAKQLGISERTLYRRIAELQGKGAH